uniref:Uncharacterized protein n=2 Tax=Oryza TaxID=4527 RepID=A0A0E0PBK6_ORYRU
MPTLPAHPGNVFPPHSKMAIYKENIYDRYQHGPLEEIKHEYSTTVTVHERWMALATKKGQPRKGVIALILLMEWEI